jgi:hypothetical protein
MRMALVIAVLAAVAVAVVHLRREEVRARHEIQRLHVRHIVLYRRLWAQEVDLARLTAPERVRWRVRQMPLYMIEKPRVPEQVIVRRPGPPD